MSIRNATIAMRQRKIGLSENERASPGKGETKRIGTPAAKTEKKRTALPKEAWASWREH